jgi:hypothetical protein
MELPVLFAWFDSANPEKLCSPYFDWMKSIGGSPVTDKHTLLKSDRWSKTLRKRIASAKPGSVIKICHLHSCGSLCIRRITQEEAELMQNIENGTEEIHIVREKIEEIVPDLVSREKSLLKDLLKTSKALDNLRQKIGKQIRKNGVR